MSKRRLPVLNDLTLRRQKQASEVTALMHDGTLTEQQVKGRTNPIYLQWRGREGGMQGSGEKVLLASPR